jgi:biopolymer transport protein ExbB
MLSGVVGFLAKGGPVMIPIVVCSVLALAVVIERAVAWLRLGSLADPEGVLARVASGRWEEAISAGERSRSPVARVLAAGVRHRNPAARLAMEASAQEELAHLRRYLPVLDTVITLSPLLGLLGTVTGMIGAFGIMAQAGLNQPTAITGGVAEALIATAAGLAVAIAALVPYNFFQRRAESMAETIERYGSRLELLLAEAGPAATPVH